MTGSGLLTRLAAAAMVALAVTSCGSDADEAPPMPPPADPADFPDPKGKTLAELRGDLPAGGPVLAPSTSVFEPGENRFGFGLFDRARRQIADAPAALYVAPMGGGEARGPFPARFESLAVKPQFESEGTASDPDAARSVYVADLPFKEPGDYEVLGIVSLDGRLVAATPASPPLEVAKDTDVPEVGERAPRISTPTEASVGGALEEIDTRVPPSTMHEADFADVVGERPAILVFATPALCLSRVCGPVVDIAEQVKAEHEDDAEFIHMEIYNDNELEQGFRPQVREWNLPSEPWAFGVDRDGNVAASLEGAFSAKELESAVKAAASG
jgi:hypothetical protein